MVEQPTVAPELAVPAEPAAAAVLTPTAVAVDLPSLEAASLVLIMMQRSYM